MARRISVIIPNRNGEQTIGRCLDAVFASSSDDFEVIVVDDCSTDKSIEIISRYPCSLVPLDRHSGASRARNAGAARATGEILFFIDADCLCLPDAVSIAARAYERDSQAVIGGTYTRIAADDTFYSAFQSLFIHYCETKKSEPDYVATHAMVIDAASFRKSGGFPEDFMPILEDVEFSHRLRRAGYRLTMDPAILVQHIFNFTLGKSLGNAFRKSLYWTIYSLANRDLLRDSGTSSVELKTTVLSWFTNAVFIMLGLSAGKIGWLLPVPLVFGASLYANRKFLALLFTAKGSSFGLRAALYYTLLYPVAVGTGGIVGLLKYLSGYVPSLKKETSQT
ncbi:MAG: glycosyltransferase family A protein [Nitrospiraceae bacterium]|nr:glycosyltransferase family A protein [Nitrospiraceae bacterium]